MQLSHLVEEYCTQLRRRCGLAQRGAAPCAAAHRRAGRRRAGAPRGLSAWLVPPRRGQCRHPAAGAAADPVPGSRRRLPSCSAPRLAAPRRAAPRRAAPPLCRQIEGSFQCAKRTAEIMRLLITTQRHPDAASLIEDVRTVGTKLQAAKPVGASERSELALGGLLDTRLQPAAQDSAASALPPPAVSLALCANGSARHHSSKQ
jgi:hypothetical protein